MYAPQTNLHVPTTRSGWVKQLAKLGLYANGTVYIIVGALAFMAAFEINGKTTGNAGKQSIFSFLLDQPFGKILVGLVVIGLICYAIWRLVQAIMDTEQKGKDAKGLARRIGYAFSGIVYGGLAFSGFKLLQGSGQSSGGSSQQTLADTLLDKPYGQWLLGLIGLITIGLGFYEIYKGLSGKFLKNIKSAQIKSEWKDTLIRAGKIGYPARGIVWGIIGYLLLKAAINANAQEAGGTESAFQFLENSTFGSILLGAVALGLICYGIFMFVRGRYETINA